MNWFSILIRIIYMPVPSSLESMDEHPCVKLVEILLAPAWGGIYFVFPLHLSDLPSYLHFTLRWWW